MVSGLQRTSPALVGALLLCLPTACGQGAGNSEPPSGSSPTTNDQWSVPVNSSGVVTQEDRGRSLNEDGQGSLEERGGPEDPGYPEDRGGPEDRRGSEDSGDLEDRRYREDRGYPEDRGGPEGSGYREGSIGPDDPGSASNSRNDYRSPESGAEQEEEESWPRRFGYAAKRRFEETLPIAPKTGLIFGDSQQGSDRTVEVSVADDLGKVGSFKLLVYGFPQGDLNEKSLPLKGKPPELLWISESEVTTWPKQAQFRVPQDPSFNLLPVVDVNGDSRMGPGDFIGKGMAVGSVEPDSSGAQVDLLIDRLLDDPENLEVMNQTAFPSGSTPSQGCNG